MKAIEFENVSKQYRLGLVSTGTIAHDLNRWWAMNILHKEDPYLKIGETNDRSKKGASEYVWALKDINFSIEQGDVVGIIGKNGAGKSTLLKLLSRVTTPSTGSIKIRGRIASLLEVGTGFHPEMTGRENIFMNGAIMGMTKQEVGRKLDEIIDFSGCERYIDTPVKRYSSGMTVRLGFAIAAHLEPEILVVDEVLAVGDAEFQKKAIGKMQDVSQGGGRTVLFVSHNMGSIRKLCKHCIILNNGSVFFEGDTDPAIEKYMQMNSPNSYKISINEMPRKKGLTQTIRFTDIKFLNENDKEIEPHCGQFLKIRVFFNVRPSETTGRISLGIRNMYDNLMLTFPSDLTMDCVEFKQGDKYADLIIKKLPLTAGEYIIALDIKEKGMTADHIDSASKMTVLDDDFFKCGRSVPPHISGKVVLYDHEWIFN